MEMKRRAEKNRINDAIRQIKTYIRTDEATIERFRGAHTNIKYNTAQVAKLRAKNETRVQELGELDDRIDDLVAGNLDEELDADSLRTQQEIKSKDDEAKQRKRNAKIEKEAKSVVSKAYYQAGRQADRQHRWNQKGADRSYKHFVRARDSIPDYMLRKLKNMPNNKGYIWKSVHCYGDRAAERGKPTVMFERQRGGILVIHETSATEYKIWHKDGKNRRVLHEVRPRK